MESGLGKRRWRKEETISETKRKEKSINQFQTNTTLVKNGKTTQRYLSEMKTSSCPFLFSRLLKRFTKIINNSQERKNKLVVSETVTSSSPILSYPFFKRQSKIFYKNQTTYKISHERRNNLTLSGTITSSSPFLLRRQSKRFYKNCTHNESHKNSIPHLTGFLLK